MSIYLDIRDCSSIFADDDDDTPTQIVIKDVFTEEVEPFLCESYELEANTNLIFIELWPFSIFNLLPL